LDSNKPHNNSPELSKELEQKKQEVASKPELDLNKPQINSSELSKGLEQKKQEVASKLELELNKPQNNLSEINKELERKKQEALNKLELDLNKLQINLSELSKEIERKKQEVMNVLNPPEMKQVITEATKEARDVVGDVFYKSVKSFFDVGFNLAKSINFDLLVDSIEKARKDKDNKKP
jgi:hypothetical protein